MKISRTVVGVDTAKRVFQLYWVDMETGEIVDLRLTRTKFLEHFANRAPCLVALEACGGSQHWGRRLRELGHEVRLLPAKMVRPFVGGNKNDAHDARAIWTAVQQPGIKTVAIKTEEQQAILALHRMRQQLVKFRTAQINCLRGLLTEYGEVMPKGRAGMRRGMAEALARVSERLPAMVVEALREQWARVSRLDEEIGEIERRLKLWHRDNVASRRIAAIPGVGVLTATAAVAMMGDPAAFRSGREFAAWLGLVPRHSGTGGRVRMLGISKRGDTYLRTLLVDRRADLMLIGALTCWYRVTMRGQHSTPVNRQAPELVVGQEALPPFPAIAPDAPAGVGALGTKAHRFRLPHDDGEHRHGAIGRDRGSAERGEPVADLPTVDVCDRASREARQDLVAQVAPVHLERSHLPDPLVAFEHGLGDGHEEGIAGVTRRILSLPDRCQHRAGAAPRLTDAHGVGIPDDLPDALAAMLAVHEEALAARGQDADAEAGELAVAGVVCGLAGLERPDAGVGEGGSGHSSSPGCGCSRGTEGCGIRSPATRMRRKNDPVSGG